MPDRNPTICNNIRNSFTFSLIFSIYEESLYETYITDIYNIIIVHTGSCQAVRQRMTKLIGQ
jgi:hypothetical protein